MKELTVDLEGVLRDYGIRDKLEQVSQFRFSGDRRLEIRGPHNQFGVRETMPFEIPVTVQREQGLFVCQVPHKMRQEFLAFRPECLRLNFRLKRRLKECVCQIEQLLMLLIDCRFAALVGLLP